MTLINKYIWVVNTLLRAGRRGLTLRELSERWENYENGLGTPLARQTFDRWREGIQATLFVSISCDTKNGYRYFIENPSILTNGELSRWLLDTYTTAEALSGHAQLKSRILTEEIPSNRDWLKDIIAAMQENRVIKLTYCAFHSEESYTFPVEPYCLKMAEKRWYLLAHSINDDRMRLYGLDRIDYMSVTDERFSLPDDFDAREYFATFYGIVCGTGEPVRRIVVRAHGEHQHYLRSLPLHWTQKELTSTKDYADFELRLRPTYDFRMELMRQGCLLEVLEPRDLRREMREMAREMLDLYKEDTAN